MCRIQAPTLRYQHAYFTGIVVEGQCYRIVLLKILLDREYKVKNWYRLNDAFDVLVHRLNIQRFC